MYCLEKAKIIFNTYFIGSIKNFKKDLHQIICNKFKVEKTFNMKQELNQMPIHTYLEKYAL